jgi:hypothetical protein
MSRINFDEESNYTRNQSIYASGSAMTNWLINKGIVKNKKGAEFLLILILIIFTSLTIFLIRNNSNTNKAEPLSEYEIEQLSDFSRNYYERNNDR